MTPFMRSLVLARDGGRCQRCGSPCAARAHSIHHRRPRQMGGDGHADTPANVVLLCGTGTTGCHSWVESHRSAAFAQGWLVHRWDDPATTPLHRYGRSWSLPGEIWRPAPTPQEAMT